MKMRIMWCKVVFVVCAAILFTEISGITRQIPNIIKVCNASDPRVTECIAKSIKDLLPKLKDGIKELNVPPMEPLHINNIKLSAGVHSNISDVNVYGVTSFLLTDLEADIANNRFIFKSVAPTLTFDGNYDLDMQIVFIPIKGRGKIYGRLNNFHVDGILQGRNILKRKKEYLHFDKIQLKLQIVEAEVELSNLFGGDEFLGEITNSIINDHINLIMDDIMPVLEKSLADELTSIANGITDRYPRNELFPN